MIRNTVLQEMEGFHVHVGQTSDGQHITITAMSKSSTEVHLLDAAQPDSAPQLVHERLPGGDLCMFFFFFFQSASALSAMRLCARWLATASAALLQYPECTLADQHCHHNGIGNNNNTCMTAGLMYWVAHARGQMLIMHNDGTGDEYHIGTAPLPTHPDAQQTLLGSLRSHSNSNSFADSSALDHAAVPSTIAAAAAAAADANTCKLLTDRDAADRAAATVAQATGGRSSIPSNVSHSEEDAHEPRCPWSPLVHCDVGVLEDMRVYQGHLVLSCREKGVPVLRACKLDALPLHQQARCPTQLCHDGRTTAQRLAPAYRLDSWPPLLRA
jgi:hypothetical protein